MLILIKNIKGIIIFFTIVLLYSCSGTAQLGNKKGTIPTYKTIAQEKYNSNYKLLFNDDSSYVICQEIFKSSPAMPQHRIAFFVYDINKAQLIFEDQFPDGKIGWINRHQIKIVRLSGNITGEIKEKQSQTLIYGVHNKVLRPVGDQMQIE